MQKPLMPQAVPAAIAGNWRQQAYIILTSEQSLLSYYVVTLRLKVLGDPRLICSIFILRYCGWLLPDRFT